MRNIFAALAVAVFVGLPLQASAQSEWSVKGQSQWSLKDKSVADPESDFKLVENIGTRQAYEAYIAAWPTGPHSDIARQRAHHLRLNQNRYDDVIIPRMIERNK